MKPFFFRQDIVLLFVNRDRVPLSIWDLLLQCFNAVNCMSYSNLPIFQLMIGKYLYKCDNCCDNSSGDSRKIECLLIYSST